MKNLMFIIMMLLITTSISFAVQVQGPFNGTAGIYNATILCPITLNGGGQTIVLGTFLSNSVNVPVTNPTPMSWMINGPWQATYTIIVTGSNDHQGTATIAASGHPLTLLNG